METTCAGVQLLDQAGGLQESLHAVLEQLPAAGALLARHPGLEHGVRRRELQVHLQQRGALRFGYLGAVNLQQTVLIQ